jgi:hypothetical protein
VAACVAPALYLAFVSRYAVNSFNGDDWSVVLVVHPALHGHLTLTALWSQYNESRLFLGNVVDVLFGVADRLDLKSVVYFSAGVYIASFGILLCLVRRYLRRPLTPITVIVLGAIWFSFADVGNSLWAFQVSWYLTVFFLISMLFALLAPSQHPSLWFSIAALAAVGASLSTIQGFWCWPLGGICILWKQPWARRAHIAIAAWLGIAALAVALYLPGYDFGNNGCIPATNCSPGASLHHPLTAFGYFFALMGNVAPGGVPFYFPPRALTRFVVLGLALCATALFILVQSWRRRASDERLPLPLLLIGFSMAFDATITLARSAVGVEGAVNSDRYVMANLILLIGIAIYALKHIPPLRVPTGRGDLWMYARWASALALTVLLFAQVKDSTDFGLTNGRLNDEAMQASARFFVNLDRIPIQDRSCELAGVLFGQPGSMPFFVQKLRGAVEDEFGQFNPNSYRSYREQGFGKLSPNCTKGTSATKSLT